MRLEIYICMKDLLSLTTVRSCEIEPTDLVALKDKKPVSDLQAPDKADLPWEWINKEALQELQSHMRSQEKFYENLEEAYWTMSDRAVTPEAREQLKEGYLRSKKAAKDMLSKLREEFDRKLEALATNKFIRL